MIVKVELMRSLLCLFDSGCGLPEWQFGAGCGRIAAGAGSWHCWQPPGPLEALAEAKFLLPDQTSVSEKNNSFMTNFTMWLNANYSILKTKKGIEWGHMMSCFFLTHLNSPIPNDTDEDRHSEVKINK